MLTDKTKEMYDFFAIRIDHMNEKETDTPNGMLSPRLCSCDFENRTATYEYPVLDWTLNYKRVMHGGIMVTIFDLSLGLLTNYFVTGFAPTTNINVNFLKPAPAGDTVVVTAKVTSAGKRLITAYGEAFLASSGEMVSNGMATFAVTTMKKVSFEK